MARRRPVVRAGHAGHDHAARPLAGDAGDRPGAGRARRRWPSCSRTRPSASSTGASSRPSRSGTCRPVTSSSSARAGGCRPTASSRRARPTSTSRWSPARAARWPDVGAIGSWPGRSPPTRRCACGSTPWARTPRSPASSGWSSRPSRRARTPRPSPTASPRCSSTSPRPPARSRSRSGRCSATPMRPSNGRSPSWSSPAPTPWDSPSRWSSPSRRRWRRGTASSSRTDSAWSGCASVHTVLFDKTGTLTAGEHVVTGVASADGDDDRLLALAGGGGVRLRAPARPGHRGGGARPGRGARSRRLPVDHRAGRRGHRRRDGRSRSVDRRCCASEPCQPPDGDRRAVRGLVATRRRRPARRGRRRGRGRPRAGGPGPARVACRGRGAARPGRPRRDDHR